MSDTVRARFRELAVASGLVDEAQVRAAIAHLMSERAGNEGAELNDRELAQQLVAMELLTVYQADQLVAGRTKLNLGPYIITDWIGQGGMGQVFKAVHEMLGRECAVKVLPINKTTPEAISNFRREIRAQAKLDHAGLVRAYDAGEDGNVNYLVVEYVPGTDLRRLVRSRGKLSVHQAASIIKQAAEGLAHAHRRNLIHRDIKPGNILVTPSGVAKLSDLGLAFHLNDPNDPRHGKIVGTADYLSPEQIKSPTLVTAVSDIYSLGCTLYYAVTGKVPFPGGTSRSKARRHLEETPWHPRRFNEEVSDEFVDLIGDMMEKNPAERVQTAEEVAERLAPWAREEGVPVNEPMDRARWQAPGVPDSDEQDTDPNDVAELGLSEISGLSETSAASLTQGSENEVGKATRKPPPPGSLSVVEQFRKARRLPDDPIQFGLAAFILTGVACVATGILIGFILGYFFPR